MSGNSEDPSANSSVAVDSSVFSIREVAGKIPTFPGFTEALPEPDASGEFTSGTGHDGLPTVSGCAVGPVANAGLCGETDSADVLAMPTSEFASALIVFGNRGSTPQLTVAESNTSTVPVAKVTSEAWSIEKLCTPEP